MRKSLGIIKISVLFLLFANLLTISGQENLTQNIFAVAPQTRIKFRMDNEINSRVSGANDTFTATISEPFFNRGVEILPEGTIIEGKFLDVEKAGGGFKNGRLTVKFNLLKLPDGIVKNVDADLIGKLAADKKSSLPIKSALILGPTAVGGILGGIFGKGGGAALGAGAGAGAGIAAVYTAKGKEMKIKANEEFEIVFNKQVNLPVTDF